MAATGFLPKKIMAYLKTGHCGGSKQQQKPGITKHFYLSLLNHVGSQHWPLLQVSYLTNMKLHYCTPPFPVSVLDWSRHKCGFVKLLFLIEKNFVTHQQPDQVTTRHPTAGQHQQNIHYPAETEDPNQAAK